MRRKLRGNTPQNESSQQPSANGMSETGDVSAEEEEEDPTAGKLNTACLEQILAGIELGCLSLSLLGIFSSYVNYESCK